MIEYPRGALNERNHIDASPDPTFLPGHAATVHVRISGRDNVIGVFGILHPSVLEKFELK